MSVVYDLGNSASWELIADVNKIAPPAPTNRLDSYYPIPDFLANVQPSSPVLAIYAMSDSAKETWRTAGFIKQRIRTGLLGGGNPDAYVETKKFYLNQFTIIEFQRLTSAYSIEFSIPYWLRDISLDIYEYTGIISDVVEQQIEDLEQKLIECCDELKNSSISNRQEILTKLAQLQQKLNNCCNKLPGTETAIQQEQNFAASSFTNLI